MAKIIKVTGSTHLDHIFFCPGCKCVHGFNVTKREGEPLWSFNGDFDKPTFNPSLRVGCASGDPSSLCHSFVTDGNIKFLNDCTHELAGHTVELPDWDNM